MARHVKVISRWERLKRQTVWHPINTDPNDEDRWGPRFWFPTYDVIALTLGIYAFYLGSPLLNRLFPSWFTDGMGIVLIIASLICLIGVCFPALSIMELFGKLTIVFMLGGYAGTVGFLSRSDDPNGFVVIVLVMAVWLLGPRVSKLVIQLIKIKDAHKRIHRPGRTM